MSRSSELDLAFNVLREKGEPVYYRDLIEQVLKARENEADNDAKRIAALYTRLNLDTRFVHLGNGMWGLRHWAAAKTTRRIPMISLLNKTVDYEDRDPDYDSVAEYDGQDRSYLRGRSNSWERA
ncbi:MAG: DNA-directed RNA polymerase subunit delta [Heliobacteriaceae bacterium]|nr:DNA-directed RNA polymerase subunit delta [Heliobacteriaceae bacterium]MDD4587931.1 DNA-directed RNA polymerase subunit delta [Heliobacteriaceae bacterium]